MFLSSHIIDKSNPWLFNVDWNFFIWSCVNPLSLKIKLIFYASKPSGVDGIKKNLYLNFY